MTISCIRNPALLGRKVHFVLLYGRQIENKRVTYPNIPGIRSMGICKSKHAILQKLEAVNQDSAHAGAGILLGRMSHKFASRHMMPELLPILEEDLLRVEVVEGRIALITLLGGRDDELLPWGTRKCEHRINPPLLRALNHALDRALADPKFAAIVVTGEGKFFSNGMDLKWIDANQSQAEDLQRDAEILLARLLTFSIPTIAAINGHFCAAGSMLGLSFDYRLMNSEIGLFFVPAIDLGLVYSPGMTSLLRAKTPVHMHTEMIVFGTRYTALDLEKERIVLKAVVTDQVIPAAIQHALQLTANGRFGTEKYRETLFKIKRNTFKDAYDSLQDGQHFQSMGFAQGVWDSQGKSKI